MMQSKTGNGKKTETYGLLGEKRQSHGGRNMDEETKRTIGTLLEDAKKKNSRSSSRRDSPTAISIDPNVRCLRIYPVEDSRKTVPELKTIGIKMSREQAVHLAQVRFAVTQEWDQVDVTAYRFDKRKSDGTYHITVTSTRPLDE
jgi:hypothetical protein